MYRKELQISSGSQVRRPKYAIEAWSRQAMLQLHLSDKQFIT